MNELVENYKSNKIAKIPLKEITVEGKTATVSMEDSAEVQFAGTDGNGEDYLSSVAMTLLQNCEIDTVRFTVEGKPYPSPAEEQAYVPATLVMPPVSQQEIEALYDTVTLEQLQANQKAAGESDSAQNPIDRWDLQGDATAKEILDTIFVRPSGTMFRRRSSTLLKKHPIPFCSTPLMSRPRIFSGIKTVPNPTPLRILRC